MQKSEFRQFCEIWSVAQELSANGKVYSRPAMVEIFEQLEVFQLDDVRKAMRCHGQQSKFAPTPADIIAILGKSKPRHLDANEAWAIALKSMDEAETVVMTQEILSARVAAWDIWEAGDSIGARMAFKSAYERLTEIPNAPTWFVSVGHDPVRRVEAISKAVDQGLLPRSELQKYRIENPTVTVDKLRLSSAKKSKDEPENKSDEILRKLEEMRMALNESREDVEAKRKAREKFEEKRKAELEKVSERLGYDISNLH